ncbi:hypothetical protein [Stenotrophomonas sp. PS02289]|uniref:hypothetical protein n=1 Tax=Stenotrophomonas sp. PS02289 TaxID=2991422 RepID=UPI00249AA954|nr:hypothetical protein [Stenotrophomonas sp. PS02289]
MTGRPVAHPLSSLLPNFSKDDGSLPEVEIDFCDPALIPKAFALLFARGGVVASAGGATLWRRDTEEDIAFTGPECADLVIGETADPFHLLLGGICVEGAHIPDLGVFVHQGGLILDYRMGPEWGFDQISALMALLNHFRDMGGTVRVPWWGVQGEAAFLAALALDREAGNDEPAIPHSSERYT